MKILIDVIVYVDKTFGLTGELVQYLYEFDATTHLSEVVNLCVEEVKRDYDKNSILPHSVRFDRITVL